MSNTAQRFAPWLLVACSAALAQNEASDALAKKAVSDAFSAVGAFSIPDSPAAGLLGDVQIGITRPQSIQALAMELASYREKGKDSPGVSLVLSPALLLAGRHITYQDYKTKSWLRQLARMELSAGLTDTADATKTPRRAALGISLTPYDEGDPRLDPSLPGCMDTAFQGISAAALPTAPGQNPVGMAVFDKALGAVPDCIKAAAKDLPAKQRAGDSLKLGMAKGWASGGTDPGWRDGGWGLWTAGQFSLGADKNGDPGTRLLARLQRTSQMRYDAAQGLWSKARDDDAVLQLRLAAAATTDVMVEVGHTRKSGGGANQRRASLGVEKLVMPDLWLVVTATASSGSADPNEPRSRVQAKVKYNFSSAPLLGR